MDAIRDFLLLYKEIVALLTVVVSAIFGPKAYYRWRIAHEGGKYDRAAFFDAAGNGETQLVRWFLHAGMNANRMHLGASALITAIGKQRLATTRLLVSRSWINYWRRWCDPNRADEPGLTPVIAALRLRRRDLFDILVDAGARTDPALRAEVLRQAVGDSDADEIRIRVQVLQAGDIDIAGADGRTALIIAVERGHLRIVRVLLDTNADPNVRSSGKTALLIAAHQGLDPIAEELTNQPRTDVDALGPAGETPLILAAKRGHVGLVKALLARNAIVETADHRGCTALMAAILGGYPQVAELLRQRSTAGEAEARLILASAAGDVDEVRRSLEAGANPNAQGADGRAALLEAARHEHPEVAQLLIDVGKATVDIRDDRGNTALMLSGQVGARRSAAALLKRKANRAARRDDGSTALMDAASSKHAGVVDELLSNDPRPPREEVDAARNDGFTPLMASVDGSEREIAERLLDAGADPNVRTERGLSPLMIAITRNDRPMAELLRRRGAVIGEDEGQLFVEARRGNLERVRQLLDLGVSADLTGPRGTTPLLEAVRGGHLDIVTLLIAHHAPVNARGRGGKTPLMLACIKYNAAILDVLLAAEADFDAADHRGRTPLLIALVSGRTDVEAKLRARGAAKGELEAQLIVAAREGSLDDVHRILALRPDIDTPGPGGETALIVACERAGAPVVTALLEAHPDVDAKALGGKTPLASAARRGETAMLDALLGAGASAGLTGPEDRTPLMIAAEHGHLAAVQQLLHAKNIPNARDRFGMTALMLAAQNDRSAIVSELIGASADIDALDDHGSSALILACFAGAFAAVIELVAHGANVDARDVDGQSPLMLALLSGHDAIETVLRAAEATLGENEAKLIDAATRGDLAAVRDLLDGPVDVNAHRRDDDTALIAAIANHHAQIALMLIGHRANVNLKGRNGRTALIAASALDDIALVHSLTAHDAEKTCEAMDAERRTAVLVTTRPDIRLHLRDTCRALQPETTVYVTPSGHCYHTERCGTAKLGSTPAPLVAAVELGKRPCSACITNQ